MDQHCTTIDTTVVWCCLLLQLSQTEFSVVYSTYMTSYTCAKLAVNGILICIAGVGVNVYL